MGGRGPWLSVPLLARLTETTVLALIIISRALIVSSCHGHSLSLSLRLLRLPRPI